MKKIYVKGLDIYYGLERQPSKGNYELRLSSFHNEDVYLSKYGNIKYFMNKRYIIWAWYPMLKIQFPCQSLAWFPYTLSIRKKESYRDKNSIAGEWCKAVWKATGCGFGSMYVNSEVQFLIPSFLVLLLLLLCFLCDKRRLYSWATSPVWRAFLLTTHQKKFLNLENWGTEQPSFSSPSVEAAWTATSQACSPVPCQEGLYP